MGDARQELEALVAAAYRKSPFSFDLVVSAFSLALHSHRRPSVCTPFPTSLFTTGHGEKDFNAAEVAVREVSKLQLDAHMTRLGSDIKSAELVNNFAKLPLESLKLMQWLLRFQYEVHLVRDLTLELPKEIFGKFFEARRTTGALSGLLPDHILKLEESGARSCTAFEECKSQFGSIFAFHGTPAENLHSILRCGLLILSNSTLQRNGAIFGEGIYLSLDPAVALGFSRAGKGWDGSYFGQRARYLLLCEVAKGDQVLCSDTHTPRAPSKRHEKNLGTYIIVQNCDLIKLRYIFVYVDKVAKQELYHAEELPTKSPGFLSLRRINLCKALILFYIVLLLGIAYINSPRARTTKLASKLLPK